MISSDVIRGHIDTIILNLLTDKDMYGYELVSVIKEKSNSLFNIKEATLYSVLQRLETKELIVSYFGEKSHGRKRRYYKITPLGRAYLKEMIEEWKILKNIMHHMLGVQKDE
ncbi:MAG: PadR family transcriptional regulator [Candidatus Izemoplasmatales bacterium]|uniref:PadR family transcriptional regulator n=1 Tax=Hujiaoplasma nucleasis TaxID=2725268 RepID=A0A7L6N6I2_9MOLU|nr:helix-turn-helix transcriptional regulator [Hujiaoplasma nucleasis]QLY40114.1 PadR family transcriptional regulator [Hujiaoplasma nucleasis]